MTMRVALVLTFLCVSTGSAQDRVIGLLALPELFGDGACDRFSPEEVPLYAAPDSSGVLGSLGVDRGWIFHEAGGCEGLEVGVHLPTAGSAALPTEEFDYEAPGVIVLEKRGCWFRIRLQEGTAWLRASPRMEYHPLERLLPERLAYLTDAFDGRLAATPGAEMTVRVPPVGDADVVRVRGSRRVGDRLWVRVELLSESPCEAMDEPSVVAEGWTPAHDEAGQPMVWFYSRGC